MGSNTSSELALQHRAKEAKNIIITGASRGLGYAIAEIFAENGNDLFLTSLNDNNLFNAVGELQNNNPGIKLKAKPFDLSKKEEARAFGEWCLKNGSPDVLVNNAGSFAGSYFTVAEDEALDQQT